MPRRRIFSPIYIIFLIYILSFFGLFLWSIITTTGSKEILEALFWKYIWINSLFLFIEFFIPITCTGILIAFSFFNTRINFNKREKAGKFISSHAILLLLLTAIFSLSLILIRPILDKTIKQDKYTTKFSNELLEMSRKAADDKDLVKAQKYIELSLKVDKNNQEKIKQEANISEKMVASGQYNTQDKDFLQTQTKELTIPVLLQKARDSLAKKDYFFANYYVQRVLQMDAANEDALVIATIAKDFLLSQKQDMADRRSRYLFQTRDQGYKAMINGDYIKAYYIFQDLIKEYPEEKALYQFINEITGKLNNVAFFLDQAELILSIPGIEHIYFINKNDQDRKEMIYIEKMVNVTDGTFIKNLEIMGMAQGELLYHIIFPYGKIIDNKVNINCIDRYDANVKIEPQYITGVQSYYDTKNIKINADLNKLEYFKIQDQEKNEMSIPDLWAMQKLFKNAGFATESISIELIIKLNYPLFFLIIALFAISLGSLIKIQSTEKPSAFIYLFVPLIPFVSLLFCSLFLYLNRLLVGSIAALFGFIEAIILTIGIDFILLTLAFLLYGKIMYSKARQITL